MEPASVDSGVVVQICEDRDFGGAVDEFSVLLIEGGSVEPVVVFHSCDEDIDTRGVAEPLDVGLDEEYIVMLCELVAVGSVERRLGRVPSVERRARGSSLLRLPDEAPPLLFRFCLFKPGRSVSSTT